MFVSRSKKLCNYVKETVENIAGERFALRRFMTFSELLRSLESKLPAHIRCSYSFISSQKMTFSRFKSSFYSHEKCSLAALTIWKTIHVFIKGSTVPLSESEYMNLGSKRNILSLEQRKIAYEVYQRYRKCMEEKKYWDDCDRVRSVIDRLKVALGEDPNLLQLFAIVKFTWMRFKTTPRLKYYCFFMLSGPESLFLAGDPAQSVVDGSDFQFTDVRR